MGGTGDSRGKVARPNVVELVDLGKQPEFCWGRSEYKRVGDFVKYTTMVARLSFIKQQSPVDFLYWRMPTCCCYGHLSLVP